MGNKKEVSLLKPSIQWPEDYGVIAPDVETLRIRGKRAELPQLISKAVLLADTKLHPGLGIETIIQFTGGGCWEGTIVQMSSRPRKKNLPEQTNFLVREEYSRRVLQAIKS